MSDDIDTRISPALHPSTVRALDGWTEETKGYVAGVETAFSEAYIGVQAVYVAKASAAKNPTLNDAAKLIQVDDFASKKMERALRSLDAARTKLEQGIHFIEGELAVPLQSKAAQSVSQEIRAHIKSLSPKDRHEFIQARIDAQDETTISAALGAPGYLSGLDDKFQQVYTRFWNEQRQPEKSARLKVMTAARDKLDRDSGKVLTAFANAVGYLTEPGSLRKIYPSDLRKQKQAAEKPFKDVA